MKIILAIVQDKDSNRLANEFIDANIRATKLSSTGGFLKAGNSTFIIGIDDERVDETLALIKETCQSRKQYVSTPVTLDITMDGQMVVLPMLIFLKEIQELENKNLAYGWRNMSFVRI